LTASTRHRIPRHDRRSSLRRRRRGWAGVASAAAWDRPRSVEVHESLWNSASCFRPDLPWQHAFAKQPPAHLEGCPMILHLLSVPAAADAERKRHPTIDPPWRRLSR
jgi:hypothetical protein